MPFSAKNTGTYLSNQPQRLALEKKVFNIASLFMLVIHGFAFLSSLISSTSAFLQASTFVAVLIYSLFFYLSNFKDKYYPFLFIIYTLFSLSISWFFFGGINGSVPLIYLLATTLFLTITQSKQHILILGAVLANILFLYLAQSGEWLSSVLLDTNSMINPVQMGVFGSIILIYGFLISSIKKMYIQAQHKAEHLLVESNLKNQELDAIQKEFKLLLDESNAKNSHFKQVQEKAVENMEQLAKTNNYLENTREELQSTLDREKDFQFTLNKQNSILEAQRFALDKSTILLTISPEGFFTYVNQNFCTISGYQLEDLEGKLYTKLLHPETPNKFAAIINRRLEKQEKWSGTIKSKTKEGDSFWLKSIIVPIFIAEKELSYYMVIATDISNEIVLQEKERAQAILYRILEVSINDAPIKEILTLCLEELFSISWLKVRKKGGIFLTGGSPYLKKIIHQGLDSLPSIIEIADTTTSIGLAAYFQEIIFVDADSEASYIEQKEFNEHHFIVPIIWADDLLGVLVLYITHKNVTKDIKIELLKSVSATLGGVLKRKQAEEGLKTYSKKLEIYNQEVLSSHSLAESQNKKILDSIRYAKRIQEAMLIEKAKIISQYKDCFIYFQPRDIVSGDFYWFAEKASYKILIAADCTGHGVPGAFMTIMGNLFLDEIIKTYGITSPEDILSILDMKISSVFGGDSTKDGMDISIIVTDNKNKKLHFSGAKNPLYYVRNNEIHVIKGSRLSVGGSKPDEEKDFNFFEMEIEEDDIFYIFSDGFQDQFSSNVAGTKYLRKRFREFLFKNHQLPLNEQEKELEQEFLNWKGDYKQTDDILVIGVRP